MFENTKFTIRCSEKKDIPHLRRLWSESFHDDSCFDLYRKTLHKPENALVTANNGIPVSVVYLYENKALSLGAAGDFSCPCFYAFSTAESFRGQRLGLNLLQKALDTCDKKGVPFTMIAPADDGLSNLYCSSFGFRPFFQVRKLLFQNKHLPCPDGSVKKISPRRYNKLREDKLSGISHLIHSKSQLKYQRSLCELCSSGLFELRINGAVAVCALEKMSVTSYYCMELLCPEENIRDFAALLFRTFPCEQLTVRMPVELGTSLQGTVHSLALIRKNPALQPEVELPESAYAGFIFD